jgi:PDZ domain-containing secreted protein
MNAGLRSDDVLLSIDGKSIGGNGTAAVDNARRLLGDLKQGQIVKLHYARQGKTYDAVVTANTIRRVMMFNRDVDGPMADRSEMGHGEGEHRRQMMMMPPDVEMDIERIGPMRECAPGNDDCGMPALFQALRWQGLNLASLDESLGRYFGTSKGVLVINSGPELKGLQSGDVIQRVAGSEVNSPRDVMRALREKDSGAQLPLSVLRDRKTVAVTITVPKSEPMRFMAPPPPPPLPPAPPAPPKAPAPPRTPGSAAPPAPPAPPKPAQG